MKNPRFALPLLLCCALGLRAQVFVPTFADAASEALGNSTTLAQGIGASFANPAGLAELQGIALQANARQRFELAALSHYGAAAAYGQNWGSIGLSVRQFGFEAYNEQVLGLAYARRLGQGLRLGIQFNLLQLNIPDYGNWSGITGEVGLQWQPSRRVQLGAQLFNPVPQRLPNDELVPTQFRLGVGWSASAQVAFLGEVEQTLGQVPIFKGGLDYRPIEALHLRLGMLSGRPSFSFGAGYAFRQRWRADLSAQYHPVLGFTPAFSLSYGGLPAFF